jgi:hypothetical protein
MKIEFYHVDAFEAANYEPIWRALRALGVDARMVAVPGPENTADPGWFDFDRLAAYYRARGVSFETVADYDAVAVTTQNEVIIRPYRPPHIRVMYGPILYPQAWGLQPHATVPFDTLLVHGPAYVERYACWKDPADLPVVGYPRYDDFFAGRIDTARLRREWQLDPTRPTIAYLPTWGDNSTFDAFFPHVAALSAGCNVVIRPHHCTMRFEPARRAAMERSGMRILENAYDLSSVYAVADVVLADTRSGALVEAIAAERRSVGLVLDPAEVDAWIRPTGLDRLAPICAVPAQLDATVDALLAHDRFAGARRAWAERHVAFRDGTAGHQAALGIIGAVERAATRTVRVPAARKAPVVSVLVLDEGAPDDLQATIASVNAQTHMDRELLVVPHDARGINAALTPVLRSAKETHVLFVSAGVYCAPRLLATLVEALDADPAAGLACGSVGWLDGYDAIVDIETAPDGSAAGVSAPVAMPGAWLLRGTCLDDAGGAISGADAASAGAVWRQVSTRHPIVAVREVVSYRRAPYGASGLAEATESAQGSLAG